MALAFRCTRVAMDMQTPDPAPFSSNIVVKKEEFGFVLPKHVACRNIFLLICCSACQLQPSGFTAVEPSGLWGLPKENFGEIWTAAR